MENKTQGAEDAYHLGCFGRSRTGKTSKLWQVILEMKFDIYFIYDHSKSDFENMSKITAARTFAELKEQLKEATMGKRKFVIFNPHEMFPDQRKAGCEFFASVVNGWVEKSDYKVRKAFICSEVQLISRYNSPCKKLTSITQELGGMGLTICIDAQGVNKINDELREQLVEFYLFRHKPGRTLKAALEQCEGVSEEKVLNLPKREFIHYKD